MKNRTSFNENTRKILQDEGLIMLKELLGNRSNVSIDNAKFYRFCFEISYTGHIFNSFKKKKKITCPLLNRSLLLLRDINQLMEKITTLKIS